MAEVRIPVTCCVQQRPVPAAEWPEQRDWRPQLEWDNEQDVETSKRTIQDWSRELRMQSKVSSSVYGAVPVRARYTLSQPLSRPTTRNKYRGGLIDCIKLGGRGSQ